MSENFFKRALHFLVFMLLLVVFLIGCLQSCTTEKKAVDYMNKHKDKLAELCADEFPAKDSIIVRDSVSFDTLYNTDIVFDTTTVKDTVYITRQLPGKTIVKTVRKDSTIVRVDKAMESHLGNKLLAANKEIERLNAENNELKAFKKSMRGKVHIPWWIIALAGTGLLGWAYWRIKAGALKKVINNLK